MRAAVELAERARRRGADRPVLDRRRGAGVREVPQRRPIIALAHQPGVAEPAHARVGRLPDRHADGRDRRRDDRRSRSSPRATSPGLEPGARVVLTAGRRTGTPGATNLVMVREIP